ncbi:radical SAM/SPASM domain-containing protein [Candidatus Nitrosarchaeum limnium]|uniref:Radical SAM domain protein n=1 Tax=Candidatus Nitrosarchaeum limnium BG20 TaxID=859192 RepID=S2E766_9ARCH|nr:radical SAM protein [Candidatus Nitrosarchaeum limnium]EPA05316.1 radical SAM domain protein [Candidatus Nitrosarchaeum limnium BG20]
MVEISEKSSILQGTKIISLSDSISVVTKKENELWGAINEKWGFIFNEIPQEFLSKKKYENFLLARKEEEERKIRLKSKPYHYVIEPTNICNLHCPLCSTGINAETRSKGTLTLEKFKILIDQIKDVALELYLQNWGESTLVKLLPDMIKYASDNKIFVNLSTNFSIDYSNEYLENLLKSGLGKLVIDVDGTTQEIFEKYRIGGKLETVLKNIRTAVKFKKENNLKFPIIASKMLVMKHNEHQIDDFKKLSKELDVDEIELNNIQINPNTAKSWLPNNPEYRYASYDKSRTVEPCHWPWSGFVVNWSGDIAPCCIVDDSDSDFGNIFEEGLEKIWNNEYYVSARSEFSNNKEMTKFTICNMCKNDTHNPNLFRVGDTFSITSKSFVKVKDNFKK